MINIVKQKIFAAKCTNKQTNFHAIIKEFEFIHELQKHKAISDNRVKQYNKQWPDNIQCTDFVAEYITENVM